MLALRELQRRFAEGLVQRDPEIISTDVAGNPDLIAARFAVYSNNFFVSLVDALAAVYPVLQRLVGEDCFRQVARRYVQRQASLSGDLHDFGHLFHVHVASIQELESLPYLADVAKLEWAWHEVFHAACAAPVMPLQRLANLSPEQLSDLHFELHPAARLLRSPYPILRIWESNRDLQSEPPAISLAEGGVALLVLRADLDIEIHPLQDGEFIFLDALARDCTLMSAFEQASTVQPEFDLSQTLSRFIHGGALRRWRSSISASALHSTLESAHVRIA